MFTASAPRVVAAEAPQVGVDPDTPYRFARGEVVDYRASLDTGRALQPRGW